MNTIVRLTRHSVVNPQAQTNAFPGDVEKMQASAAKQLAELRKVFGDDVIIHEVLNFQVVPGGDPVVSVREAIAPFGTVDAIEVVLPPNLLSPLLNPKMGLPMVIRAKMSFGERRPEGQPPAPASFEQYEKMIKVDVLTEPLIPSETAQKQEADTTAEVLAQLSKDLSMVGYFGQVKDGMFIIAHPGGHYELKVGDIRFIPTKG